MLSRLRSLVRRLRHDERGSAVPLFGLAIIVIFGFGAVAVDGSILYATKNSLTAAADAAALAGVRDLPDSAAAVAMARQVAAVNMPVEQHGEILRAADIEIGIWNPATRTFTATNTNPDAIRVTTRRSDVNENPQITFLAGVLGVDEVDIMAVATAVNRPPVPICILVLHPTMGAALTVWGSAELIAQDCVIQVNSSAGNAVAVGGAASIEAQRTLVVGGASGTRITPSAETGMPAVPDPLASLPAPPLGSCASSNEVQGNKNSDTPVYPGRYCGGLRVRSNTNAVFQPGIYIIDNGTFEVDANATARGSGVFFYIRGPGGRLNITGGPEIDFSAPTSGTYAGIVFFAERGRANITHRLRGNADMRIDGVIYTPSDHLDYSGTSDAGITVLITNTAEFQGNSSTQRFVGQTTVPLPVGLGAQRGSASLVY